MYRIEVAPGEETVFRTIEELAIGIRNGVVTQRSRIFHNASQKWLPIGLHPHYKKALEMPAASLAHPTPPSPVTVPATRKSPAADPRPAGEHRAPLAPATPAPTVSAVVAMQQEVLRDLPVVVIPEPLPWSAPRAAAPAAPAPAPTVRPAPEPSPSRAPAPRVYSAEPMRSQPSATLTYAPRAVAEPVVEPESAHPDILLVGARPTARRSRRPGGRPLLLLGVAAALVVGAHFALTPASRASADELDVADPADLAAEAQPGAVAAEAPRSADIPADLPPKVTSSPAQVRMTPGPAFAGSVPAPAGSEVAAPPARPVSVPAREPSPPPAEAPGLEPAPIELDLAVPDIGADSMAPVRTGDTLAMKRILRALNGTKPQETAPAP